MAMVAAHVTIRRARPEESRAVSRLFGALHGHNASLDPRFTLAEGWEHWLREFLDHERSHDHSATFLAHRVDEAIGLAIMDGNVDSPLYRHRHWAELVALYVSPAARGTGVAEQLMEAGLDWAVGRGFDRLQLYVTAANEPARRFYARLGLRPTQEIWATDLPAPSMHPPRHDDHINEPAFARGHHVLSVSQNHLHATDQEEEPTHVMTP